MKTNYNLYKILGIVILAFFCNISNANASHVSSGDIKFHGYVRHNYQIVELH